MRKQLLKQLITSMFVDPVSNKRKVYIRLGGCLRSRLTYTFIKFASRGKVRLGPIYAPWLRGLWGRANTKINCFQWSAPAPRVPIYIVVFARPTRPEWPFVATFQCDNFAHNFGRFSKTRDTFVAHNNIQVGHDLIQKFPTKKIRVKQYHWHRSCFCGRTPFDDGEVSVIDFRLVEKKHHVSTVIIFPKIIIEVRLF